MHPEALAQWIIDAIDDGLKLIRDAERGLPLAARRWADSRSTFGVEWPDWAKDAAYHSVMAAMTVQLGSMRDLLNFVRDLVAGWGLPTVLRDAATKLEQGLGKTVADFSTSMRVENLKGLNSKNWTSDAATSYLSGFQDQEDQVDGLGKMVDALIRVLRDGADSQDAWYKENLIAVIGIAVSIGGLVAGIVTAPETLGIGFVVGIAITIVGVIVSAISLWLTSPSSEDRATTLENVLIGAPIGTWTQSAFVR